MKKCKTCGEEKQFEEFPVARKTPTSTHYRAHCTPCTREYRRENYKNSPELKKNKQKYEKERWLLLKTDTTWYKEKLEKLKKLKKSHYQRNKARLYVKLLNRREKVRKATPPWANIGKMMEIYALADKKSAAKKKKYEVDHIVPLKSDTVCGLHVEYNLQIITRKENRRKHNNFNPAVYPEQGRCASYEDTI